METCKIHCACEAHDGERVGHPVRRTSVIQNRLMGDTVARTAVGTCPVLAEREPAQRDEGSLKVIE